MTRRRCPRCHTVLDAPARFCPRDGSALVEIGGPAGGMAGGPAGASAAPGEPPRAPQPPAPRRPTPRVDLTGQVLDGQYAVLRRLGEGGMSHVYLAQDRAGGGEVALKVLSPRLGGDAASVQRLQREAELAMRLDHPNICRILRHGRTPDGLVYLVMPYLEGELLSEREARLGTLPLREGVDILVQLCRGLDHAHRLNLVHRDLKPENVMLVPDPARGPGERAVILDFGLAKERLAGPEATKLTATGVVLGTPEFMSPEQIRGAPLDGRSDLYALALLGFEMFTGRLPFEGRGPQDVMIARLRGQPKALRALRPEAPAALEAALLKGMALSPDDRPPDAGAFAEALARSLG